LFSKQYEVFVYSRATGS